MLKLHKYNYFEHIFYLLYYTLHCMISDKYFNSVESKLVYFKTKLSDLKIVSIYGIQDYCKDDMLCLFVCLCVIKSTPDFCISYVILDISPFQLYLISFPFFTFLFLMAHFSFPNFSS